MKIESGKLDRKLELLIDETIRELGQEIKEYTPHATIWAERLEMRTVDAARAGQRDTYSVGRFKIRYRADLTTSMRIHDGSKLYDIVAVDEMDRRAVMIITVEEARA